MFILIPTAHEEIVVSGIRDLEFKNECKIMPKEISSNPDKVA